MRKNGGSMLEEIKLKSGNGYSIAEKIALIERNKKNVSEEKIKRYKNGISKKEATVILKNLVKNSGDKPLILKSKDDIEAKLSGTSANKLVSNSAVDKSITNGFTREQHYVAASDIESLYKNSLKAWEHSDRSGDPNVKAMHRFVAPLFGDNAAYITIKEATEQGKRIYTIELIELGKLEGMLKRVMPQKSPTTFPASSLPIK
jgi:hypothetical protein